MKHREEIIGDCRLILGDCREAIQALPRIDCVITDPPYEIVATGGGIGGKRKYLADITDFTDCGFDYSLLSGFDNWVVFGTLKQVPKLITQADGERWMLIVWNKPNPTPLCGGNYLPDTEYIIHRFSKGMLFGGYKDKSRFIIHPCEQGKEHPNEKPIPVMMKVVSNASGKGMTILDPFMGSGTTGVACVNLGRKFIGIEIEEKYFDIACRRIEKATKNKPRLFDALPKPKQMALI